MNRTQNPNHSPAPAVDISPADTLRSAPHPATRPGVFLDWTKTGSAGYPAPCIYCRRPAICRAPNGRPCHKTCAEARTATPTADLLSDQLGSAA